MATTARKDLLIAISKTLDTTSLTVVHDQDFDFEENEEFVSYDILNLINENPQDDYTVTFQISCISKLDNIYSLSTLVDTVRDLFLEKHFLNLSNYSGYVFGYSENRVNDSHIALTFTGNLFN